MKKVLIVDDALFMRYSLRTLFEKNGFEVIGEAEDGYMAIQMYKELHPDIVTMDITMPGINGVQTLKEIRALDEYAKVVMITSLGQENRIREAIQLGAKGFIMKPWKEEHVIQTLSSLV